MEGARLEVGLREVAVQAEVQVGAEPGRLAPPQPGGGVSMAW